MIKNNSNIYSNNIIINNKSINIYMYNKINKIRNKIFSFFFL